MKAWQFLVMALFFVAFLAVGKIFRSAPENEAETLDSVVAKNLESTSQATAPGVQDNSSVAMMPGLPSGLKERIMTVDEGNLERVFNNIELVLQEKRNPSIALVEILKLETSDDNQKSSLDMVKGYALNSFMGRLQNKSDFLPGPMVEIELVALLKKQQSGKNLNVEAALHLMGIFGYNRDKLIDVIDNHPDRDEILEEIQSSESN